MTRVTPVLALLVVVMVFSTPATTTGQICDSIPNLELGTHYIEVAFVDSCDQADFLILVIRDDSSSCPGNLHLRMYGDPSDSTEMYYFEIYVIDSQFSKAIYSMSADVFPGKTVRFLQICIASPDQAKYESILAMEHTVYEY